MEGSSQCRFSENSCQQRDDASLCCERGASLSGLSSLINHSCNPNVRRCFTEDIRTMIYALMPINKGSQV